MKELIKDKNQKLSSKRIIAFLSVIVAIILTFLKVFNIGDIPITLIAVWLTGTGLQGFSCAYENR